jgi:hypothetical protein
LNGRTKGLIGSDQHARKEQRYGRHQRGERYANRNFTI